jgi:hypothetical protein
MNWRGHPMIEFRLKEVIDIDSLPSEFDFVIKRDNGIEDNFSCKVNGANDRPNERRGEQEDPDAPWTRWVSIEGTTYSHKTKITKEWLLKYGEFLTELEEDKTVLIDEDGDIGECSELTVGVGNLKVKMRITDHIPQFIPMNGRKVKIYYRGMEKMCINCYRPGHMKVDCEEDQVVWLEYVERFIASNTGIDPSLYGRYVNIVKRWRENKENESTSTIVTRPSHNSTKSSEPAKPSRSSERVQNQKQK